ncbi:hypothetical protein ACHAQH_007537, partial [Verticillium albo-atrum]
MLGKIGACVLLATTVAAANMTRVGQSVEDEELGYDRFAISLEFHRLTDRTHDLLVDALRRPNLTRSVEFNPFGEDVEATNPDETSKDYSWTWRVNVSEVQIPGAKLGHETDAVPRVAVTSHSFTWPGSSNMSTQLDGDGPFCIEAINPSRGFAPNITNAFDEDDVNSTSCEPALGAEC